MVEVVLFEVKQHKYKLVLGWVTVPWVVLLIDRSHINQEPNAGTLLCYDHDLSLIPVLWWYCILDGHPWWIYLHEINFLTPSELIFFFSETTQGLFCHWWLQYFHCWLAETSRVPMVCTKHKRDELSFTITCIHLQIQNFYNWMTIFL